MDDPNGFKQQRLYPQFSRVAQALASEKRLELIDLLAQAPRNVDALASLTGMSMASTSQHLQVLLRARLVEARRLGTKVEYQLADESVSRLWLALRATAEARLPEVSELNRELAGEPTRRNMVARDDVAQLLRDEMILVIDVRPTVEYEHGHLPGAISIPAERLAERLDGLPRDRRIVAYCRGRYCMSADEAVAVLRGRGFDAVRLDGGWPEWRAEGRETAV